MRIILKPLCIAFSMYSKIPMPQFPWKDEDMKYVLCFFPWIGAVIGLLEIGWFWLCVRFNVGHTAYFLVASVLPALTTGGFHIDGFMDTSDALSSYQSTEKKLAILKDSHIGAFSVVRLLIYFILSLAAYSEIHSIDAVLFLGIGFTISRELSGISVMTLKPAKKDGMLRAVYDSSNRKVVILVLCLQLGLSTLGLYAISLMSCMLATISLTACFIYYRHMAYQEFNGVTGDTAGYFLSICELAVLFVAAFSKYL